MMDLLARMIIRVLLVQMSCGIRVIWSIPYSPNATNISTDIEITTNPVNTRFPLLILYHYAYDNFS